MVWAGAARVTGCSGAGIDTRPDHVPPSIGDGGERRDPLMDSEALVAAIKAGDMVDTITALCAISDRCWVARTPGREELCVVGVQLGTTNVYMTTSATMEWHSHSDAATAAACLAMNRERALDAGFVDTGLTPESVAAAMPNVMNATGERIPDALVEVDGRQAAAYYV